MIIGHGIDLEDLAGIAVCLDDPGWISRCFRSREQAELVAAGNQVERWAGRFCVKEAVLKALGCGQGAGVSFRDVEVLSDAAGRPFITLHDGAQRIASDIGAATWQVSISHAAGWAMASVIAEAG